LIIATLRRLQEDGSLNDRRLRVPRDLLTEQNDLWRQIYPWLFGITDPA
jgi:hypothetical protein